MSRNWLAAVNSLCWGADRTYTRAQLANTLTAAQAQHSRDAARRFESALVHNPFCVSLLPASMLLWRLLANRHCRAALCLLHRRRTFSTPSLLNTSCKTL
eukprot:GHRQ01022851.1.p1 GENE.GHRQ01022851.1~~GHRQ01022851.1.p1  ORF type:complete len:100 (+),score=6.43 GHRQ01022851.1:340-639(+)